MCVDVTTHTRFDYRSTTPRPRRGKSYTVDATAAASRTARTASTTRPRPRELLSVSGRVTTYVVTENVLCCFCTRGYFGRAVDCDVARDCCCSVAAVAEVYAVSAGLNRNLFI